jgi:hypothetical protein
MVMKNRASQKWQIYRCQAIRAKRDLKRRARKMRCSEPNLSDKGFFVGWFDVEGWHSYYILLRGKIFTHTSQSERYRSIS